MRAARSGPRVEAAAEILLVDDDPATARLIVDLLEPEGYRVWQAPDAAGARVLVGKARPDVVILEIMLPDESGLLLCSELRARWPVPILLVSATRRRSDRLIGLRLGAADFIAKPFSGDELKARVEAALHRAGPSSATASPSSTGVRRVGELVIDQRRCRVALGNRELRLTATEYRLLGALAGRPDELLSRKELTEQIWGYYDHGVANSLEVHMRRLRAKLNTGSAPAPQLLTVRGYGYKLSPPGGANPGRGPGDRHLGPRGRGGADGSHPPRAGS
jgi:DNA-binding response OmpR family regulator